MKKKLEEAIRWVKELTENPPVIEVPDGLTLLPRKRTNKEGTNETN